MGQGGDALGVDGAGPFQGGAGVASLRGLWRPNSLPGVKPHPEGGSGALRAAYGLGVFQWPFRPRLPVPLPPSVTERTTVTTAQPSTSAMKASIARFAAMAVSTPTSSGPK